MTIIGDVLKELFSMFAGDLRLTIAILILVAAVAAALHLLPDLNPLVPGVVLLAGCLLTIVAVTALQARRMRRNRR